MLNSKLLKISDEELVKLTLQNEDNFLYLMERYESKLSRFIQRISSLNKQCSEDLLQEIFIKVYKNLNSFDIELKFSSWIYRITRNSVISEARKRINKTEISLDDEENQGLLNLLKSSFDTKKDAINEEISKKVREAINEMPIKYREVLILRFMEYKDYQEISDILKKPEGTVATLINRAKKSFKLIALRNDLNSFI